MTLLKSLRHNLCDGVDVPAHRTHQSKKGKDKFHRQTSFAVFLYKKRKKEMSYDEFDEKNLHLYK